QGKRSLTLNLKAAEGQAILHQLVPTADVLIEQFRPGVARELGVDYQTLAPLQPDLIYCSFSGFGAVGPYRTRPAHDINFLALAGGLDRGKAGDPAVPPVPAADISSAMLAAFGIVAALLERERTGGGRFLDLSLFDAALQLNQVALVAGETFLTGTTPGYALYRTADDRFLSLGALEERFWDRLCTAIERPDLRDLDWGREEDLERARLALQDTFLGRSVEEWDNLLARFDVPAAPVRKSGEVAEDPHVEAMGALVASEAGGPRLSLAHPIRWKKPGPARRGSSPRLGQHTREILHDLGYEEERILDLDRRGVVELNESEPTSP
ncbi:MAG: CaiB/BaiF CoA-transferase family protein, partial [Thermoplasmata archaeon]|nr:CaiB/BaiF CoA-transferase family protein [Thermoplasmata archaeon]